jgi:hypothetical protein
MVVSRYQRIRGKMLDIVKVSGFNNYGQNVSEFFSDTHSLTDAIAKFESLGFQPTEARFTK